MDLFKSLRMSRVKIIRHALAVVFVSHFFVQAFQHAIETSSMQKTLQNPIKDHMNINDLSSYKDLMTSYYHYDERFYVLFSKIPGVEVLDIMGLSIRNGELCDIEITQDSPGNMGMFDPSNNSSTSLKSGTRQGSRYVSHLTRSKFSGVKSFQFVIDTCPFDVISEIAEGFSTVNALKAMKFIFFKFSPDSQEIILKRFISVFPQVSNCSEPKSFSDYVDTLISCQNFNGKEVEFFKSMLSSLFIETTAHDCIGSLPVNLSSIKIQLLCDSLICLNIAKSLERFTELESVHLSYRYFEHSDLDFIQSLNTLPNCKSIRFENIMLTNLFLEYLKNHFDHNAKAESREKSVVFEKLTYVGICFYEYDLDIDPGKIPCLKEILSRQDMKIFISSSHSEKSIKELSKIFSEDELNKITFTE